MSITHRFRRIPVELINFVREYPDVLELLGALAGPRPVSDNLDELLALAEEDESELGWYGRLTLPTLRAFLASPFRDLRLGPALDLDAAGYAIHFLFTGTYDISGNPIADLVPNERLRHEEGTVADALVLPPAVEQLYARLVETTVGELVARFDPAQLAEHEVYPEIWHDAESRAYVFDHLTDLDGFVEEAVEAGDALVLSTTL